MVRQFGLISKAGIQFLQWAETGLPMRSKEVIAQFAYPLCYFLRQALSEMNAPLVGL
jgi:hypothetical protein